MLIDVFIFFGMCIVFILWNKIKKKRFEFYFNMEKLDFVR